MTIARSRRSSWMAAPTTAFILLALHAPTSTAQGVTDTLALEGGAAPGGGTHENLSLVKLNDFGQVAFQSYTNVGFTSTGIFLAQRGIPIVQIVRTGQSTGNGTFALLDMHDLNNAGQVVFSADLAGTMGGSADNFGIFRGSSGSVTEVIRTGVPLPLSSPPSGEFGHTLETLERLRFLEGPVINDSGLVAFKGRVNACEPIIGGCAPVSYDAVMRSNTNGTMTLISTAGDAAPVAGGGSLGTMGQYVGVPPSGDPTALINNSGRVLFRATIDGSAGEGIFWANGSFISDVRLAVARSGQTLLPGAPGAIQVTHLMPIGLRSPLDMNDAGDVALGIELNPSSGGNPADIGVYRWSPQQAAQAGAHGLTEIARTGRNIPDGNGTLGGQGNFFTQLQLNEKGQVAFWSYATSAAFGSDDRVVLRGDGENLTLIARRGQLTPDGQFRYRQFANTAINDAGQIVFSALLADPNDENQFLGNGLFLSDGIETIEIMRPGRPLAGGTVSSTTWIGEDGVNSLGQVAYLAELADGRDGAFLFTLENLRWRTMGNGNWDDSPNWTVSTQPGRVHHVLIDPDDPSISLSVNGPATNVTIRSLVVGDSGGVGQRTLNLQAGTILNAAIDLVVHSNATVNFAIGGTDPADFAQLTAADGAATLNGTLSVSLVDQGSGIFVPSAGDMFMILSTEDGIVSQFTAQQLPTVAGGTGLTWQVRYNTNNVTLEVLSALVGDYNGNGVVDASDYTVWQDTLGQTGAGLAADGDRSGIIDIADHTVWKAHFGQTAGSGSGAATAGAIPEPASLVLLGLALPAMVGSLLARQNPRRAAVILTRTGRAARLDSRP